MYSIFAALAPKSGTVTECLTAFDTGSGWIGCTVGIQSPNLFCSEEYRTIGFEGVTCRVSGAWTAIATKWTPQVARSVCGCGFRKATFGSAAQWCDALAPKMRRRMDFARDF